MPAPRAAGATDRGASDDDDAAADPSQPLTAAEPVPSFGEELAWLGRNAAALFLARLSWVMMKTTDSAVLGRVGTHYLSASSISDFYTSCSGVFIQGGVLGVFCGNAYGAGNKKLVGMWLQVSYVVLAAVLVPVWVLWLCTEPLLRAMGKTEVAHDAGYYAVVLSATLPCRIIFGQLGQYFTAQGLTTPTAKIAPGIMLLNLVLGIGLVLGWPFSGWGGLGFPACPIITSGLEWVQAFLMWFIFCYWRRMHEECWPGWSWSHISHDNYARVREFFKMYLPAALSIASDFWRFAFIGGVAAWIGDTEAAVFNTSYRILWIALTFVGSVASAMGIRLGQMLGKGSAGVPAAKHSVHVAAVIIIVFNTGLAALVCAIPRYLSKIFSTDEQVHDLFESSRWPLATLTFTMVLAVGLEKVPMAIGRTKEVFRLGLVGSWVGQVPAVLLCTHFWKKDLNRLYVGASIGYALLCVLFIILIATIDWEVEADKAQKRAEVKRVKGGNVPEAEGGESPPALPDAVLHHSDGGAGNGTDAARPGCLNAGLDADREREHTCVEAE